MSTQRHIEKLIQISREHTERRTSQPIEGIPNSPDTYFSELHSEIDEAKAEIRKNNTIHLEDELGDIFWDYCLLLSYLEQQGYIDSVDEVFARSLKKYKEREPAMKAVSGELWDEIKKQQKEKLAKERSDRYGGR